MRHTDIAIAGGGLAGSLAGAMLGRMGIDAIVVDPHPVYPPDFRCEKLDPGQLDILNKTGLADAVRRIGTLDGEVWIARFGRIVEKRPNRQIGLLYDTLVNTVRAEIPKHVEFIHTKATQIAASADRSRVTLADGEEISARLVVVANGLNIGLRQKLGIERDVLSANHSISIGFDVMPAGRAAFDFPALTYYGENPADRIAYLTLFPIGATIRANLFVYRDMQDPWLRQLREAPQATLFAAMPGLRALLGDFTVPDFVKIRPVDLYATRGHRMPGVVLVGDAFATSCPAAGTGARKVLNDVERLCNIHIPRWLATPGMGEDKIAAFYDDPVKQACDAASLDKAFGLRSFTIDPSLPWATRRWAKFGLHFLKGKLRPAFDPRGVEPESPLAQHDAAVPTMGNRPRTV